MFSPSIAFVDLETTGTLAAGDRITEVGIVRVDGGTDVSEWNSLVNPECSIPGGIHRHHQCHGRQRANVPPDRQ